MMDDLARTILADPPWNERGGGKIKRGADRHYPLMKTPEIIELVRPFVTHAANPDTHLYLWTTNNFLPDALTCISSWGYRYITILTWDKEIIGLGQYFRGQTEHLIFAVRGQYVPAKCRTQSTLIRGRRGRHSAKPEEAYAKIEAVSPGPYLELFARTERPGWTAWGNSPDLFTRFP